MTTDPPSIDAVRDQVIEELVRFVRQLRAAGVTVPADGGLVAAEALGTVGLSDEHRARIAVHAAVVGSDTDRPTFDRLFDEFWDRLQAILEAAVRPSSGDDDGVPQDVFAPLGGDAGGHTNPSTGVGDHPPTAGDSGDDGLRPPAPPRRGGAVRDRRISAEAAAESSDSDGAAAQYSPGGASQPVELDQAAIVDADDLSTHIDAVGEAVAGLRARTWERTGDRRPDVRRALRRSVSSGGVMLPVPEQDRARTATRATLLVDVSQSVLDTIDRGFLIRFLRGVTARWRQVRVFFFDTDVREVTDAFDTPSAEAAVAALDTAEAAWGGGTRIGHAFDVVRTTHPRAVDRRTAVFVISDGLEVGDVDQLADGAAWLDARAAMVLWLNPLAADHAYEPTVRGMAAARPHVDGLFAFTEPRDIEEIARQLGVRGPSNRIGYEFDRRHTPE